MLHGLCFGEEAGARNLVFFRVKWLQATMKGTLVCATGAAAVVLCANCSSYVFCNEVVVSCVRQFYAVLEAVVADRIGMAA